MSSNMKKFAKYDPNADYVCVAGRITLQDPKTAIRTYIEAGAVDGSGKPVTFKMSHRTPPEIAFLVEKKGLIAPATTATPQKAKQPNNV